MTEQILIPSSEWVYFKIYTGTKSADKVLSEIVKPYVDALIRGKVIKEYFFIRYNDPNFHIRLRLNLSDNNSFNMIFQEFNKHFSVGVNNRLIWNYCCPIKLYQAYKKTAGDIFQQFFYVEMISQAP